MMLAFIDHQAKFIDDPLVDRYPVQLVAYCPGDRNTIELEQFEDNTSCSVRVDEPAIHSCRDRCVSVSPSSVERSHQWTPRRAAALTASLLYVGSSSKGRFLI